MTVMKITKSTLGSDYTSNPLNVKRVQSTIAPLTSPSSPQEESPSHEIQEEAPEVREETPEERRTRRQKEFKEDSKIRERAIAMQKKAEEQLKETQTFKSLMDQAREDPTVLAKALNMDLTEFQRKLFNKAYSINEEPKEEKKPETFEEETRRRFREYEKAKEEEKAREIEEATKRREQERQNARYNYIQSSILPLITEEFDCIHANGLEASAEYIYDIMQSQFAEQQEKIYRTEGRKMHESEFTLKAIDVINELEEHLYNFTASQIEELKKFKKFSNRFSREEEREEAHAPMVTRRVNTLSKDIGYSAPPSTFSGTSSSISSASGSRLPLKNREARRRELQKVLGQK